MSARIARGQGGGVIVLALGNVFGPAGGIPAFNQLLVRAACERARLTSEEVVVLALADDGRTPPDPGLYAAHDRVEYVPCAGSRGRLVREVLARLPRRPRLVLGHAYFGPLRLGALAGRGFGVVAHGLEVWRPLPPLRRHALRLARAVAYLSDYTMRAVRAQGVQRARCLRLINALDPRWFGPGLLAGREPNAPRPGAPPLLLSITRLHPGEPKGIDLTLRALAQLPEARYLVAGDGADRPRLEALARELGVADRVEFRGAVEPDERAALLRACDVFVLPSASEGFGIVYLEAMAYSKPCVASHLGGVPEVIEHERTGLLGPQEVPFLVSALGALTRDEARRRRLGEAGRERVRTRFVYERFQDHAERFLEAL